VNRDPLEGHSVRHRFRGDKRNDSSEKGFSIKLKREGLGRGASASTPYLWRWGSGQEMYFSSKQSSSTIPSGTLE